MSETTCGGTASLSASRARMDRRGMVLQRRQVPVARWVLDSSASATAMDPGTLEDDAPRVPLDSRPLEKALELKVLVAAAEAVFGNRYLLL